MSPSGIAYARKGQRVELSCLTNSAFLQRKWSTKCSTNLPSNVYEEASGRLTFLDVTPCQSGMYTCKLSNLDGIASRDVLLAVDLTKCNAFIDY